MNKIEVPSWVVEIAAKVLGEIVMANSSGTTEHDDGVTIHMTKSVHELGEEALRAALTAALGAWVVREPYRLGNRYMTQGGHEVTLNQVANYGTSYESMCDDAGVHRYTRRDFGRVTGSAHDYSDQRNIPPLYTLRQEKPE